MKQRSSRKNRMFWIGVTIGLIVLFIVGYLYISYGRVEKKDRSDETVKVQKKDRNSEDHQELTTKKTKQNITYSEYKEVIKEDKEGPGRSFIDDGGECNHQYALLELIILNRAKAGRLRPYIPGEEIGTGLRIYNRTSECPAYGYGESPGTFRFLIPVLKNCEKNCIGILPDTSYKLESLAHHRNLNYMIEIPPAEELVFRSDFDPDSFEGTKEDPVHRIPILIDDVLATKDSRARVEQIWTSNELTITGIPHIDDEETERHLNVGYYFRDTRHSTSEKTASKKIELEVKTKTKDNVSDMTGGLLVIYGTPVDPEYTTYTRLLGYIPEVQANPVSFSKSSTLRYKPGKWVQKRINIESIIKKNRPKILEKIKEENKRMEGIFLEHQKKEYRKKVYICIGQLKEKEDGFYTTLEAPPGAYRLKYGNTHLIKENFTWPPKN